MPQCTARAKSTGVRCARSAIAGATICRVHGGAAPQVRAAARARLLALVDPAISRLGKLLQTKQQPVALGAVKDVLDRGGLKAPEDGLAQVRQGPAIVVLVRADVQLPSSQVVEIPIVPEPAGIPEDASDNGRKGKGLPNVVLTLGKAKK